MIEHPASDVPNLRCVCTAVVIDDFPKNCTLHSLSQEDGAAVHVNRKRFEAESNLIRWDTQKLAS